MTNRRQFIKKTALKSVAIGSVFNNISTNILSLTGHIR